MQFILDMSSFLFYLIFSFMQLFDKNLTLLKIILKHIILGTISDVGKINYLAHT